MSWNPVFVVRELLDSVGYSLPSGSGPYIFVGYVPQDTPVPYVRVVSITGTHREHMQGPAGSAQSRLQVDWWDTDAERLNYITESARHKRSGLRGTIDIQGESFEVRRLHCEETTYDGEPQNDASGVPIYQCQQEWRLDYVEQT